MSLQLFRRADLTTGQIADLDAAMAGYYQQPPTSYYQMADQAADLYYPAAQPFHCDLVGRVFPGATVLEAGCGTAHLCPQVERRGGAYTGQDHGERLLADNRRRFPNARFLPLGAPLAGPYDLVASLYTIEHIADPPAYLEFLWQQCRPGGLIGIICPEFIDSPGFAPSLYFGKTPRRLREKLKTFSGGDLAGHLLDWKIRAPRWKRRARAAAPGAFWINLRPSELHGATHGFDTDAVHMTRLQDLVWFFQQKNARIVQTSTAMSGVTEEIRRFNCYVLVEKPVTRP